MAGIGFVLRRLASRESISASLGGYAYAGLVSAGPWLFTCAVLTALSHLGGHLFSTDQLQRARTTIIYNFSFSLIVAGPIVMVVTRRLADAIHARDVSGAPGLLLGALGV